MLNLSLEGPDNTVLSDTICRLVLERDIVVVAVVANDGPGAEPAFPAAYDVALAVTAVDREDTVCRRAVRGPHVDLAPPCVNTWTAASILGARWKTGMSFAVHFVTAAAAMLREAEPNLNATEVGNVLRARANDLRIPGPDETFGSGHSNIEGLCDEPFWTGLQMKFLRRQRPAIRLLCEAGGAAVIAPPILAKGCVPDWFRKLPAFDKSKVSTTDTGLMIKRCIPFLDPMNTGWVIPLPATVRLGIRAGGPRVDAGRGSMRAGISTGGLSVFISGVR